jgi:hypothetical protein
MEQSRIKQLELIQGVIARLTGHSSPSKVLLSRTGVIGAAARLKRGDIVWPALIHLLTCWGSMPSICDARRCSARCTTSNGRTTARLIQHESGPLQAWRQRFRATSVSASILGLYFPEIG